jgi:transcriptional regulator with XRE-family HTH domain
MDIAQCRAARGLLNWSQERLADAAAVSVTAIRNFERGATQPMRANLAAIRTALEAAGVEFIPENGGGAGVRLRKA